MKNKIDEKLKPLDAELSSIYETRDILTGRIHTMHSKPYEVVISFPVSLGERGFRFSMYYDEVGQTTPWSETADQIYTDFRKELKDWIKDKSAFCGAYEEIAIKQAKKVLRLQK